ncbi:uncharacterized protein LOC128347308 [Hemicordylus capensis]|uniref:uncharacterized protein LOC128347308 n=1 Tax=Hemicordylus capensis TaxID=884348 RepID=UPI002303CAA7|nr:uncharacterized protein LOC128347308 [Hemicordylus capensis]XP_053157731.1 uncharacterized protein LOC128347308 [Hemicordylus capensis]
MPQKHATETLELDVESMIIKVYSHFGILASRTEQLMEKLHLLRHVTTRWSSLLPAINRLLMCWKPLSSYFQSQKKKDCPKVRRKIFLLGYKIGIENDVPEVSILFLSHTLKLFTEYIDTLEQKHFSISVYGLMADLYRKLESRSRGTTDARLSTFTQDVSDKCVKDFLGSYERAQRYLSDKYDFSDESFHSKITTVALHKPVVVNACSLKEVDKNELYEEYCSVGSLPLSSELEKCNSAERYCMIFSRAQSSFKHSKKMASYVFLIPCSNAHTETVFSLMATAWRNERNRLEEDTGKTECQVCTNLTAECKDMYTAFLSNRTLLRAAKNGPKYKQQ